MTHGDPMAESYESPPTDLMIRRAFEFPWTRRKRLNAWQQWTSQHWDSQPATSAATETITSQQDAGQHVRRTPEEEPEGDTGEKRTSEAEQQAVVAPERAIAMLPPLAQPHITDDQPGPVRVPEVEVRSGKQERAQDLLRLMQQLVEDGFLDVSQVDSVTRETIRGLAASLEEQEAQQSTETGQSGTTSGSSGSSGSR